MPAGVLPARFLLAISTAGFLAACGKGTPVTVGTPSPPPTPPPVVSGQFKIPTASSRPLGIAVGSDGNFWFTESVPSKIGQLNTAGKISENSTPTRHAFPNSIASGSGPNLNLWFTETKLGRVAQITTSGPPYVEYTLPNAAAKPTALTLGPDGNMWVADPGTQSIWRVQRIKPKPYVKFTQFPLTGHADPTTIITGPDSALWFTEAGTNRVGRIPISGSPLIEYHVATTNVQLNGLAAAGDGTLWFIETKAKMLGRMTSSGAVTNLYPLNGSVTPDQLLQGADSNFYFTDPAGNKIGQFYTHSHKIYYFTIPTTGSEPTAMTLGNDFQIYFVETAGNKIGQFRYVAI